MLNSSFILPILLSVIQGSITILLGVLIRTNFEMLVSIIVRRPFSKNFIEELTYLQTMKIIELIGLLIIIYGAIQILIPFNVLLFQIH